MAAAIDAALRERARMYAKSALAGIDYGLGGVALSDAMVEAVASGFVMGYAAAMDDARPGRALVDPLRKSRGKRK